jgi:hypothetical protein
VNILQVAIIKDMGPLGESAAAALEAVQAERMSNANTSDYKFVALIARRITESKRIESDKFPVEWAPPPS